MVDEIEKRFKKTNDSMTSYHIRCAAVDLCVAWAHMTEEEVQKTKICEIIDKLNKLAEEFERRETNETQSHAAADR